MRRSNAFSKPDSTGRRFRIDTGTGIFELSVDKGVILTNYGKEPIFEVELELFSGETEELVELGNSCRKNTAWKYRNSANMQEASN